MARDRIFVGLGVTALWFDVGVAGGGLLTLLVSLLLGTICLTIIGALGSALTVNIRRGGLLLSLLIIPLNVPVLIFGTRRSGRQCWGVTRRVGWRCWAG
ncbi:MAG: hypothetical protein CM15mP125_1940 [Gammaproteobacteria bacterium]|nr:MAG: hypothetical protein CM15mP125_1940 [Gammaproteobacteria bacterium]